MKPSAPPQLLGRPSVTSSSSSTFLLGARQRSGTAGRGAMYSVTAISFWRWKCMAFQCRVTALEPRRTSCRAGSQPAGTEQRSGGAGREPGPRKGAPGPPRPHTHPPATAQGRSAPPSLPRARRALWEGGTLVARMRRGAVSPASSGASRLLATGAPRPTRGLRCSEPGPLFPRSGVSTAPPGLLHPEAFGHPVPPPHLFLPPVYSPPIAASLSLCLVPFPLTGAACLPQPSPISLYPHSTKTQGGDRDPAHQHPPWLGRRRLCPGVSVPSQSLLTEKQGVGATAERG